MPEEKKKEERKYRVVSNGTVENTRVYDPEGRQVGLVTRVAILIDSSKPFVEMTMQLADVELDIEARNAMEKVKAMTVEDDGKKVV